MTIATANTTYRFYAVPRPDNDVRKVNHKMKSHDFWARAVDIFNMRFILLITKRNG